MEHTHTQMHMYTHTEFLQQREALKTFTNVYMGLMGQVWLMTLIVFALALSFGQSKKYNSYAHTNSYGTIQ
jgi:hypothetical protein